MAKKKEIGLKKLSLITFVLGAGMIAFNFLFFSENSQLFGIFNMAGAVVILGAPLIFKYVDYKNTKEIEAMFPRYLNDVAENIGIGMTLPQAMKAVLINEYGVLNPHVKELSAKISWGVPFEKTMAEFAKRTKSKSMKRNIQTVIETHKSGGQIATILVSVSQSLQELEKIKKERTSSLYSQVMNGYLIYLVFLGVMVGLSTILIPAFNAGGGAEAFQEDMEAIFIEMFRALTIIQGFFAGLAIGKMSEGTLVAGLKHSMVLVVIGYSAFVILV